MRRIDLLSGVTVLALGFLSAVPAICATEPPEVDANQDAIGEPFGSDVRDSLRLPLQTNTNLSLGAVTESPDEAAEADKLAKQLANPIASLIRVPFQANEDWGFGPTGNGYKFTLNIQPVIPISITPKSVASTTPTRPAKDPTGVCALTLRYSTQQADAPRLSKGLVW